MPRSLFAYLLFVGLPLGALGLILRAGERLSAPAALHGRYAVTLLAPDQGGPCLPTLLLGADSVMVLEQSGPVLSGAIGPRGEVPLRGVVGAGTAELRGRLGRAAVAMNPACPAGDSVVVEARFDRSASRWTLEGVLRASRCLECPPVPFRAEQARVVREARDA